jgi:hypothetical protein
VLFPPRLFARIERLAAEQDRSQTRQVMRLLERGPEAEAPAADARK